MAKRSKKQARRLRNLVMTCTVCAIVLTVSTYAWFIGMKTVNVSTFDIEIATTEGLYLSMDGKTWSYNLDAKGATAYDGNTNMWAEDGLIPMSTVGDMDSTSSRMKLFEKASLTTTTGGYRLLSSRVQNYATSPDDGKFYQGKGYVAFDLFIKNISGTEYYFDNEPLNEEAIYLTTNSAVTVASDGEKNTGIENSVRVAFAQIGRVKADTTSVGNITQITCSDVDAGENQVQVTGICRNAQIWEPNDTDHVQNAINWYNTSCLERIATGSDETDPNSYVKIEKTDDVPTNCGLIQPGVANKTYAVSRTLTIDDNVDIYDGETFNKYKANSVSYDTYINQEDEDVKATYKLVDFPYFTDTMKDLTGTDRPQFMSLAPNSITKVRVYIFIEGQDVDNYDFASLGKKISVNFGFTKERYTEDDVDYDGPSTDITPSPSDEIPIVITPSDEQN